ncbi:hypothetical protein DL98DRAFT_620852 [Cadophora sp. DSE1049]|nr:hypothetical protein DL98DRAFT_620852 [Cadophora sp. DSE1049]
MAFRSHFIALICLLILGFLSIAQLRNFKNYTGFSTNCRTLLHPRQLQLISCKADNERTMLYSANESYRRHCTQTKSRLRRKAPVAYLEIPAVKGLSIGGRADGSTDLRDETPREMANDCKHSQQSERKTKNNPGRKKNGQPKNE